MSAPPMLLIAATALVPSQPSLNNGFGENGQASFPPAMMGKVFGADKPVVLASGSPRRKELLRELFPEFEVLVSDVDEDALTVEDPFETAESLARAKALAVLKLRPECLVIGGDTVVALPRLPGYSTPPGRGVEEASYLGPEGPRLMIRGPSGAGRPGGAGRRAYTQLAKPTSYENAVEMLESLSGRTHLVITGICAAVGDEVRSGYDCSRVTFRAMTRSEIEEYVATGETMDKAGGYASQGGAKRFIERLDGSVSNVIGLPVEKLREILEAS